MDDKSNYDKPNYSYVSCLWKRKTLDLTYLKRMREDVYKTLGTY